ncbi:MAG: hypothetical protein IJS45_05115 [Clostridia bacterium]|nr:hypothetical protein [Clostridia bacterium]
MKKVSVFILLSIMVSIICLASCSQSADNNQRSEKNDQTVTIPEDLIYGPLPDENAAVEAATEALISLHIDATDKRSAEKVDYDDNTGIWTVHFARRPEGDKIVIGDEYSVQLNKSDGKVIEVRYWE